MSFRFSLEALHKLRHSQERQQELLLQRANQQASLLQQQIAHIETLIRRACEEQLHKLENRVTASELQFDVFCRSLLTQQKCVLQKELASALALRDTQREAFRQARRRREVLDSLRTHHLELFQREQMRQEQRRADEEVLLRADPRPSG
jgi:flagellar export protein FliJ